MNMRTILRTQYMHVHEDVVLEKENCKSTYMYYIYCIWVHIDYDRALSPIELADNSESL